MRLLLRITVILFALLALFSTYLLWRNNIPMPQPSNKQLDAALENSIHWLIRHQQDVLNIPNPMLWRMIQQASDITNDATLKGLFKNYEDRYLKNHHDNIWRPLFYPNTWVPVRLEDISSLPPYNLHFIYAYTCDQDLAKVPVIRDQNDTAFCNHHPLRPACVTHQMMGMLLLKRSNCGDQKLLDRKIHALQQHIQRQLKWDPRVVDVYMQRVLMLVKSGADSSVKPVWLWRLMDAQLEDGGWSPFMPLIPVGNGRSIGVDRLPGIKTPKSSFHMTAQGVLLFSLLTTHHP